MQPGTADHAAEPRRPAVTKPAAAPALARRQLRRRLRRAREQASVTQQAVTKLMDWSPSKIIRLEAGHNPIGTSDLRALLMHYRVAAPEVEAYVELARAARTPGVVDRYRAVLSPQMADWIEYEASSAGIRWLQINLIPGIAQTRDYASEVIDTFLRRPVDGETPEWDARRQGLIDARVFRGELLTRADGPRIALIIDEAALRRRVGGTDLMRAQLERLKMLNTVGRAANGDTIAPEENPGISIQVVPYTEGVYPQLRGAFELLEFSDEDENLIYLENGHGNEIIRDAVDEPTPFFDLFLDLQERLRPPTETNQIIDDIIESMAA
jgi:transcriptional regulator with XRE-family HTH domain